MNIFSQYQNRYELRQQEEYSLEEYLDICKNDSTAYASAAERLLIAIGEPEFVDTSKDPRLSSIFSNKVIKRYENFSDFYGMKECIEEIVSFFKHASQGLEEKNKLFIGLALLVAINPLWLKNLKLLCKKYHFTRSKVRQYMISHYVCLI
jgi:serine protein kinase